MCACVCVCVWGGGVITYYDIMLGVIILEELSYNISLYTLAGY